MSIICVICKDEIRNHGRGLVVIIGLSGGLAVGAAGGKKYLLYWEICGIVVFSQSIREEWSPIVNNIPAWLAYYLCCPIVGQQDEVRLSPLVP